MYRTAAVALVFLTLLATFAHASFIGWGNPQRLGQASRTYSLQSLIQERQSASSSNGVGLPNGKPVKTVICAREFIVLTDNGIVYRIGIGADGAAIDGFNDTSFNTINQNFADRVIDITCSYGDPSARFVVTATGRVFSWGNVASASILGHTGSAPLTPTLVTLPSGAFPVKVVTSPKTTFFLSGDGTAIAYGNCGAHCLEAAQIDFPDTSAPNGKVLSIPGEFITDISVSTSVDAPSAHTIFCTASGKVFTAGTSSVGALMQGAAVTSTSSPGEVTFSPVNGVAQLCRKVLATQTASIVLMRDGSLYSAGKSPTLGVSIGDPFVPVPLTISAGVTAPFDIFPIGQDQGVMVVGSSGGQLILVGWGNSLLLNRWTPNGGAEMLPVTITYLTEDSEGKVTFCQGTSVFLTTQLNLGVCTLTNGEILIWGDNFDQISFETGYNLPNPQSGRVPSRALIRGDNEQIVAEIHDENPSPSGALAIVTRFGSVSYRYSGLTAQSNNDIFLPFSGSATSPVEMRRFILLAPLSFSVALTSAGKVYYSHFNESIASQLAWEPVQAFDALQVVDLIAFIRPSATYWVRFQETLVDDVLSSVGYLALTTDGSLYWHNRAPIEAWESGADRSLANLVAPSLLFGAATPPTIKKLIGKYDTYFILDTQGRLWSFGDDSFGQTCTTPGASAPLATATLLTSYDGKSLTDIIDVFPLVQYYNNEAAVSINLGLEPSNPRATIIVTTTAVIRCSINAGNLWNNLPNLNLPASINASNPIVAASFTSLSGVIQTNRSDLWGVGRPEALTSAGIAWRRYNTLGALASRAVGKFTALTPGGAMISTDLTVISDPTRRIVDTILFFDQSPLTIFGNGFGSQGDGQTISIFLTVASDTYLSCAVQTRTPTMLTCLPTIEQFSSIASTLGPLNVSMSFGSSIFVGPVTIGSVVRAPVVSGGTPKTDTAIIPGIAENADTVEIYGTGLSSITRVELVPTGTCVSLNVTDTKISCTLRSDSLAGIPVGFSLSVRAYYQDMNRVPDPVFSYVLVARPEITAATNLIQPRTAVLNITGSGFDATGNMAELNQVFVRVGDGPQTPCAVLTSVSTSTFISCRLANESLLDVASGVVSAVVRSFNGRSQSTVIGSVGVPALQAPSSGNDGSNLIGGVDNRLVIGLSVAAAILVLLLVVFIIVLVRRRRNRPSDIATTVDVPKEMAAMFNIKNTDLEVIKKLGEGSFGAVFLCNWKPKNRRVALKKLLGNMMSSHIDGFFREATLMTGIPPHKNIVRIWGLCQEQNNFSLVMEFLRNGSLDSYLAKRVFADPDDPHWDSHILHRIVVGVARGMSHLATNGIVHRDLAARNVLLGAHCEPKISDFGMSRMVGQDVQTGQTNSTVGPIKWMPPESLRERLYSEKSDVWAYGVTLYELTTGREPFEGEDFLKIVLEVRDSARTVLTDIDKKDKAKIPKYIYKVMEKCFAQDPADRPTFAQIADELAKGAPFGYTEAKDDDGSESSSAASDGAAKPPSNYGNALSGPSASPMSNQTNKANKKSPESSRPAPAPAPAPATQSSSSSSSSASSESSESNESSEESDDAPDAAGATLTEVVVQGNDASPSQVQSKKKSNSKRRQNSSSSEGVELEERATNYGSMDV